MDKEQFWGIVSAALDAEPADVNERGEIVIDQLCDMSVDQVIAFDRMYNEKAVALYTWDMVMATYLVLGDLAPDKFDDFRAWIISRGRTAHKLVRGNPDELVTLIGEQNPDGTYAARQFRDAANVAYRELQGHDLPEPAFPPPAEPLGTPWDDSEEQLKQRLPRLYAATRG